MSRPVDDLVELALGGRRALRRDQVADAVGVPLEEARRLWRAMGFADVGDAEAFTEQDVAALRIVDGLMRRGTLDEATAADLARSLGQTMSRLADWQVDILGRRLVDRGLLDREEPLSPDSVAAVRDELVDTLPALEQLLVHVWRRQLAAAVERGLADATAAEEETAYLTVGFADQVGFTRLARRMEESELAALVERFESRAADIVVAAGGRVIKTLGDEILFVAASPRAAARAGLGLLEAHAADGSFPRLRIGLATGTVVARRGDVFGTTVNLASRLTALARPDTVLVDERTALALESVVEVALRRHAPRAVRGIGLVRPVELVTA